MPRIMVCSTIRAPNRLFPHLLHFHCGCTFPTPETIKMSTHNVVTATFRSTLLWPSYAQWHSKDLAWMGTCLAKAPCMFVLLMSHNLAWSVCEWLAYSRCPANTNDLATPLLMHLNLICTICLYVICLPMWRCWCMQCLSLTDIGNTTVVVQLYSTAFLCACVLFMVSVIKWNSSRGLVSGL